MSEEQFSDEDVDALVGDIESGRMAERWDWLVKQNILSFRASDVMAEERSQAPAIQVWESMPPDPPEGIKARLRRLYEAATGESRRVVREWLGDIE